MSKQNKGALSSNNVQEKLSQGLAANKNNKIVAVMWPHAFLPAAVLWVQAKLHLLRLIKTITKRSRTVP